MGLRPALGNAATIIAEATLSGAGTWNAPASWQGGTARETLEESAQIRNGYTIAAVGMTNPAASVSNEFGVNNGQTIKIEGGSLAHTSAES